MSPPAADFIDHCIRGKLFMGEFDEIYLMISSFREYTLAGPCCVVARFNESVLVFIPKATRGGVAGFIGSVPPGKREIDAPVGWKLI